MRQEGLEPSLLQRLRHHFHFRALAGIKQRPSTVDAVRGIIGFHHTPPVALQTLTTPIMTRLIRRRDFPWRGGWRSLMKSRETQGRDIGRGYAFEDHLRHHPPGRR